jgi:hypothetical protein
MPTTWGVFRCFAYRADTDGSEHLALVAGDPSLAPDGVVQMLVGCIAGNAFGSLGCSCPQLLGSALTAVEKSGRGVLVYSPNPATLTWSRSESGPVLPCDAAGERLGDEARGALSRIRAEILVDLAAG